MSEHDDWREVYEKTDAIRKMLDRIGMEYTTGHLVLDERGGGCRTCEERVTNVFPVSDEFCEPLAFAEDDMGHLSIDGEITPKMAVLMAVAASMEGVGA